MMTPDENAKTIDWIREWVHRLEDRDDYEAFSEIIARLKQSIEELQTRGKERRNAL
jgi:hypothetical protein